MPRDLARNPPDLREASLEVGQIVIHPPASLTPVFGKISENGPRTEGPSPGVNEGGDVNGSSGGGRGGCKDHL